MLDNMHVLNDGKENPRLQQYWEAVAKVIDSNDAGAQRHRHSEKKDLRQTTNISYNP